MKGNSDWIAAKVIDIIPINKGMGIFLEAEDKIFVIQVDIREGVVLGMCLLRRDNERPLPHELISHLMLGFGIEMTYCLLTEVHDDVYHAALGLVQDNELGKKIVELDCRPSDGIAQAILQNKPIYILKSLFLSLDDMREPYEELARQRNEQNEKEKEQENED